MSTIVEAFKSTDGRAKSVKERQKFAQGSVSAVTPQGTITYVPVRDFYASKKFRPSTSLMQELREYNRDLAYNHSK